MAIARFLTWRTSDRRNKLEAQAAKLVEDQKIKNIRVVVPLEFESGPANYGLNPDADLTVLFYRSLEVKSSRAYGAREFTKGQVSKLLEDISKIVKSPRPGVLPRHDSTPHRPGLTGRFL